MDIGPKSRAVTGPCPHVARLLVLMGVSGCGKSSVGAALARRLGAVYIDADELHPAANIAKMAGGEPLIDDDRWPWLALVGSTLATARTATIVGCSALKREYRTRIVAAAGAPVTFIHLAGSRSLIEARLGARRGHFMPKALLDSQFATLEPPEAGEDALTVDIEQPLEAVVATIADALQEARP